MSAKPSLEFSYTQWIFTLEHTDLSAKSTDYSAKAKTVLATKFHILASIFQFQRLYFCSTVLSFTLCQQGWYSISAKGTKPVWS